MNFLGPLIEGALPWLAKGLAYMGFKEDQIQKFLARVKAIVGRPVPTQPADEESQARKELDDRMKDLPKP